jgi:polar amino acid transport system substrate-binding protein
VLHQQNEICVAEGRDPVDIQTLSDQATMALAIRAGRIDASFAGNAALVYFQSQNNEFEVVGAGENLMGTLWQASVTPRGSELTDVILDAWQALYDSGEYERIMTKWGVSGDMLKAPGINMAK